ncbi:MAG: cache domain-containing protein [Arcobacter sp.]|jgi:signal transduction histidine kinase|uniref:histidine kinase n=1 Tax=Arcobacter defluvii TaxID=873191 RepID=A0AAE7BF79_9BACT|nr:MULTISPECIES: cache domain-containing protein [Arcobacter]MDY3199602.1 cache domain-containing protein [Arcobacter sp.]QKF76709.1 Cache sensor-containing two-component system histidine kinase [Arcobacter defluvii]RXI34853.1 histidine kinase [Arcobacter defluvii]BAK72521.1 two-component sensor kinase [Arcobacter sp. L]
MLKAKSLYHLIVYSILFIIVLISFFTFIIIDNAHEELQEKIHTLKIDYTNNQKALIKNHVNYIINFIDYYYNQNKDTKSVETIQKEVIEAIEKLRITDNRNEYIFIYDFNGKVIQSSVAKENIGKNFLNVIDPNGKEVIKELINTSKKPFGGYVDYVWFKPEINKETNKVSYAKSYNRWNWTVGKGVYLDEIDKLVHIKEEEYNEKISNYTLQITSLTIMLILYSIFIYKNATILIVNDVKEIGKYFKESQKNDNPINQNRIIFGEFKVIANYATDAMNNIKLRTHMLEDLNKNLEYKVNEKTKELTNLIESQKQFIKNSVHEINTPLSIIQTNIDLLKMKIPNNKYITNIESGSKIIQYIYDDLSYLVKKDRVIYEKEYLDFTTILKNRLDFFDEIAKSNSLYFINSIEDDLYIKFNNTELQRIIDNNLSNAIKYSYAKSPIFVKLYYLNDDEIEFSVATNSQKIENTNKIFDDFYRENSARGGFGLGLKIVKDICDKNLVIIRLDSKEKETKFTYRFKINEDTTT